MERMEGVRLTKRAVVVGVEGRMKTETEMGELRE